MLECFSKHTKLESHTFKSLQLQFPEFLKDLIYIDLSSDLIHNQLAMKVMGIIGQLIIHCCSEIRIYTKNVVEECLWTALFLICLVQSPITLCTSLVWNIFQYQHIINLY